MNSMCEPCGMSFNFLPQALLVLLMDDKIRFFFKLSFNPQHATSFPELPIP